MFAATNDQCLKKISPAALCACAMNILLPDLPPLEPARVTNVADLAPGSWPVVTDQCLGFGSRSYDTSCKTAIQWDASLVPGPSDTGNLVKSSISDLSKILS